MLTHTTQTKWDFYQPANSLPTAAFDIRLDNVKMVTAKDALAIGTYAMPPTSQPLPLLLKSQRHNVVIAGRLCRVKLA